VLASLLAIAALANPVSANLDADPAPEQLVQHETTCFTEGVEHAPPCGKEDVRYEMASVIDDCGSGPQEMPLLKDPHETFVDIRAVEADGDPSRREILVEGYSGAAGRVGEARLVRLAGTAAAGTSPACRPPRVLLEIPGRRWRTRKPAGAGYSSTGFVQVRELDRRYKGREVVLRQPWYRRDDAGCCPTWSATAVFRYDRRRDRYVKLRERVRRFAEPR
jgi:hypothetical protein